MTTPHIDSAPSPNLTNGDAPAERVAPGSSRLAATVAPSGANESNNPPRIRSRRREPDYRLRGLDPSAQARADVLARPTRRPFLHRRIRRIVVEVFAVLAAAALAALLLRVYVLEPFTVQSNAMVPALRVGDQVLVVHWRALTGSMDRGDIVAFHPPAGLSCGVGDTDQLVGRVIGLPGERIASKHGSIYIDGRKLHEPDWYDRRYGQVGSSVVTPTRIPRGDYYVMNDNRSNTCDSRIFGVVPRSSIVGTVVALTAEGGHPDVHFF
jgi:signal peptidase I